MKNLFKSMMLVAVAAMGFTACSKEAVEEVNPTMESKTYTMTFVADAPNTRTSVAIDGDVAKYSWSTGDKVGFYKVANGIDSNVEKAVQKSNSKAAVIADNGSATFTVDLDEADGATSYNIGAFYPGNSWVSHAAENPFNNVKVKLPQAQALTEGTFDPAADLMMSKPFMGVALDNEAKTLEFTRIAAVGMMNLKLEGMENGEVIKEVVFTLAEGTHFNGPVTLDLENSTYTLGEENTTNSVNLTGELTADADRTAIFFTCFPGEYSGAYTINVTTDKATYSKEGTLSKPLSFTAGDVLSFNATVTGRDEIEVKEDVCYKKITSTSELTEGQYLIVCEIANVAFDGSLTTLDANNNKVDVTISNNQIAVTEDLEEKEFTLTKNGNSWYILAASGKYIGSTSSNDSNELKTSNTGINNTITVTDGDATITNGHNYLRYNATTGTCRFRYYKSSTYTNQKAITLYKKTTGEGGETPEPTPALATPTGLEAIAVGKEVTIAWDEVANATSYYVTCGTQNLTVTDCEADFTMDAYSTEYNITVVAKADGYTDSVAATTTVITEADPNAGGEEVTFELSNTATFTNSQLTWSQNGITIVQDKGKGSSAVNSDYNTASSMRVYQGHTLTFSSEYNITKVEIATNGKYYGTTATASEGTLTNPKTNGCTITWEGSSNNFVITNGTGQGGEQIRATKITITYTK